MKLLSKNATLEDVINTINELIAKVNKEEIEDFEMFKQEAERMFKATGKYIDIYPEGEKK